MLSTRVLAVYAAALSLKLLLLPAPYSTDLEVHRHWKSLTYHKPIAKWYTDESSVWTLDYPPLFAYLECLLAHIITPVFPSLTAPDHTKHTSTEVTVLRITVLLCEPLLLYAISKLSSVHPSAQFPQTLLAILLPGLTLVDNIHFQYNALPLSLLLLTLYTLSHRQPHLSAILFSLTLNLKQTFLPLSPVIAAHLLAALYHSPKKNLHKLRSLTTLAITTITTLLLPWLPLLRNNSYKAAFKRLFPLHRGLLHANWAANLWAPYAALDRLLLLLGFTGRISGSTTTGVINNARPFAVLPNPSPHLCIGLTLLSMSPFVVSLIRSPTRDNLLSATSAAGLSSFIFGWHVHEKAVLVPLLPLALSEQHKAFVWLSLGGQFALLGLLRDPAIAFFLVAHFVAFHAGVFAVYGVPRGAVVYFVGCLVLEAYSGVLGGHRILFGTRMEFLPIMLVSLYAFVGVAMAYVTLLHRILGKGKID